MDQKRKNSSIYFFIFALLCVGINTVDASFEDQDNPVVEWFLRKLEAEHSGQPEQPFEYQVSKDCDGEGGEWVIITKENEAQTEGQQ